MDKLKRIKRSRKSSTSRDEPQSSHSQSQSQSLEDYDNPVAPWLSSNLVQSNLNMNYLPPDTPPMNKELHNNKSATDLSEKGSIDNSRHSGEHKRKGWKHLLKPKASTASVHSKDYADYNGAFSF